MGTKHRLHRSHPYYVGGGISELADIEMLLEAGADKISINSAAVKNPQLVADAAKQYGSECITVAIDGRKNRSMPSGFEVVIRGGTQPIEKDAAEWAKQCEDLGASVLLPTSVDGDGTQSDTIWNLHGRLPTRPKSLLSPQEAPANYRISSTGDKGARVPFCWRRRSFISEP
jgi:phosphoribosylformimino-5-aminoimidazole carboxamide ribonucleotide (ProFAR) isomerase